MLRQLHLIFVVVDNYKLEATPPMLVDGELSEKVVTVDLMVEVCWWDDEGIMKVGY